MITWEEIIRFYRDVAGLETSKEWQDETTGNGIILEAGRASLELIDRTDAASIDDIEVGRRVAGSVRLALNIGENIEDASEKFIAGGAIALADVKQAPWSKVRRLEDPSGMQFTLFETSTLFENGSKQ